MGGILSWLTGGLSAIAENIVLVGLTVFALALGFFAISYLKRRRQVLDHERVASLLKGLHRAGIDREFFEKAKPRHDAREHLLRGLRWLFGAIGLSGALCGYEALQPTVESDAVMQGAVAGLVPASIGLAHLLFGWVCARRAQVAQAPQRLGYYRVSGRRF